MRTKRKKMAKIAMVAGMPIIGGFVINQAQTTIYAQDSEEVIITEQDIQNDTDVQEAQQELDIAKMQVTNAEKEVQVSQEKVNSAKTNVDNAKSALDATEKQIQLKEQELADSKKGVYGFYKSLGENGESAVQVLTTNKSVNVDGNTYTVYGTTKLGQQDDTTSFENVKTAIGFIYECNELRKKEGKGELKVSPYLMAVSQVQTNVSSNGVFHSGLYSGGENLAWGYSDPFYGWYTNEKHNYETRNGGQTGHYLNIINESYQVTGFSVNQRSWYGTTHGQTFSSYSVDNAYSTKDFERLFLAYYNRVKSGTIQKELDALKTKRSQQQNTYKALSNDFNSANATLVTKKQNLENAKQRQTKAQEAYDFAVREVTYKRMSRTVSYWNESQNQIVDFFENVKTINGIPTTSYKPTRKNHTFTGWSILFSNERELAFVPSFSPNEYFVTENNRVIFYKGDFINTDFTGMKNVQGKTIYFSKGVQSSFTGLVNVDNTYKFVRNGVFERLTGISRSITDANWYFSRNGVIDWNFTGVANSVADGNWYFCRKGKVDWNFTGISQSVANGKWYFSRNGKLDWNYTGIAMSIANNQWYFVRKGQLDWGFTGVAQSVANNQWYHCKNGKLDWGFTGISKSSFNGKWYFSRNGKLDWSFTGLAKSIANGKYYFVRNGEVDWKFTGVARSVTDGQWYFARRGVLDWSFTGAAKSVANGLYYFIRNGKIDWKQNQSYLFSADRDGAYRVASSRNGIRFLKNNRIY